MTEQVRASVRPGLSRYRDAVAGEIAPAARPQEKSGVCWLPDGEEVYTRAIYRYTSLDASAEEIHQIGLDEVARIHDEMRGVMAEVGFAGDLQEFFEFLNTDDQFFYEDPDDMIQAYRDMSDNVAERQGVEPRTDNELLALACFRCCSAFAHAEIVAKRPA